MSTKVIPVEPQCKLDHYQVECRDDLTGYWKLHSNMCPLFKKDQRPVKRYTLCGVREVIEEFITNQEAAEDAARARALNVAKTIKSKDESKDVRVRAFYFERDAGETYEIECLVWENNKFKDC